MRLRDLGWREGSDDREREASRLDQLADLAKRMDRAARVATISRTSGPPNWLKRTPFMFQERVH